MAQMAMYFKHENPSSTPSAHIETRPIDYRLHTPVISTKVARQEDLWSSLASSLAKLASSRFSERLSEKKIE